MTKMSELSNDHEHMFMDLPPDFALVGGLNSEPKLSDEVLHGPNAKEWQAALDYEIGQLEKLKMWVIEVLANAVVQDWEIKHIDVKSTYLNAPLKETIYMRPPQGVLKPGQEGKVC